MKSSDFYYNTRNMATLGGLAGLGYGFIDNEDTPLAALTFAPFYGAAGGIAGAGLGALYSLGKEGYNLYKKIKNKKNSETQQSQTIQETVFLNENSLAKILALSGGLAGAALAGSDFMDAVHQGEQINPIANPDASVDNTLDALASATKIPFYGIGGAIAGGIAGASLNAALNSKSNKSTNNFKKPQRRSYINGS